jgi:hypothetical protein
LGLAFYAAALLMLLLGYGGFLALAVRLLKRRVGWRQVGTCVLVVAGYMLALFVMSMGLRGKPPSSWVLAAGTMGLSCWYLRAHGRDREDRPLGLSRAIGLVLLAVFLLLLTVVVIGGAILATVDWRLPM